MSLNNLIVDGALVSTTPCFLGADPAAAPLLGGGVNRPLARVEDSPATSCGPCRPHSRSAQCCSRTRRPASSRPTVRASLRETR